MDPRLAITPMPARIARLPRDPRGYPIPWFVASINGVPDLRLADAEKRRRAIVERRCFTCGERLGAYLAFVIGPMCAVNRVSGDPPSHRECAEYALRVCPFLTRPHMVRRDDYPEEATPAAGVGLTRNPGVALLWITHAYTLRRVRAGDAPGAQPGVLLILGDPLHVGWWIEGRAATHDEVFASIASGLPALRELATAQGPTAIRALDTAVAKAYELLPAR